MLLLLLLNYANRIHPNVNGSVSVHPISHGAEEIDTYYSSGHGPVHVVQGNTGAMQDTLWIKPKPRWSAIRFANGFIPSDEPLIPRSRSQSETNSHINSNDVEGMILSSNYTDTFGIGIATFANSSHLYYQAIPITGDIGRDEFWIVKKH